MKKITLKQLEKIKGGGCYKWLRRAEREIRRGGNREVIDALIDAFSTCTHN